MAKSVKQDFESVISSDGNGNIIIKLSSLPADAGLIIEGLNGRSVQFREPAQDQTNAPGTVNACVDKRVYQIGEVLDDGWIVGPISPNTGYPISIEPVSGALEGNRTWYQGEEHAADLERQGHLNARQPADDELYVIYRDIVKYNDHPHAKFDHSASSVYWSSTSSLNLPDAARVNYFGVEYGQQMRDKSKEIAQVRCVRDEPNLTLA